MESADDGHVTARPSPTLGDSRGGETPRAPSTDPSLPSVEEQAELAGVAPKGQSMPPIVRRSDSVSRSKRQAARPSRQVEDPRTKAVRKPRASTLVVPEEKRCEALTTLGARCKAPRLRGLKVCMFHGHLATDDERLATLADPKGQNPPLSPRRALKAVAALRAGELAVAAVAGALAKAPDDGGRALLALVDAVDPVGGDDDHSPADQPLRCGRSELRSADAGCARHDPLQMALQSQERPREGKGDAVATLEPNEA